VGNRGGLGLELRRCAGGRGRFGTHGWVMGGSGGVAVDAARKCAHFEPKKSGIGAGEGGEKSENVWGNGGLRVVFYIWEMWGVVVLGGGCLFLILNTSRFCI
jgi:hypothetical protein